MPGNLGSYQTMVVLAKRAGGPKRLAVAVAAAGWVVPRAVEAGVRQARRRSWGTPDPHYQTFKVGDEVTICHVVNLPEGVSLPPGGVARVIEQGEDAVLIEVVGRRDNPHIVPASALEKWPAQA